MADPARKAELIATLDRARSRLSVNAHALRDDLNVAVQIQRSFTRHRTAWFGGATLVGLLLAKLPARTKKVVVTRKGEPLATKTSAMSAGLLVGGLKLVFAVCKPWLTGWLAQRITTRAGDGPRR